MQTFVRGTRVRLLLDSEHMFVSRSRGKASNVCTEAVLVEVGMAAVAYRIDLGEVRVPRSAPVRLVGPTQRRGRPTTFAMGRGARTTPPTRAFRDFGKPRHGLLRRIGNATPGLVVCCLLVALWFGAGALTAGRSTGLVPLPGAKAVPGGYLYVVHPGDTLWGIATRVDPTGDVRPLVAKLEAEVRSTVLTPGTTLVVP